ncbi:hypothetical protein BDD12DRAFT_801066 [Trichophaea hybrida]|nr:hypothetical protein BDD12DRAFT_801066 [Trichophaea hybrida]
MQLKEYVTERPFYRAQILANAEVLSPSHDPKLITIDTGQRRTLIISSSTGEVLLKQDGAESITFWDLFSCVEKLLAQKVKGYVEGMGGAGVEGVGGVRETEIEVVKKRLESVEAQLAAETSRREELEKRLAALEQRSMPVTISGDIEE